MCVKCLSGVAEEEDMSCGQVGVSAECQGQNGGVRREVMSDTLSTWACPEGKTFLMGAAKANS